MGHKQRGANLKKKDASTLRGSIRIAPWPCSLSSGGLGPSIMKSVGVSYMQKKLSISSH